MEKKKKNQRRHTTPTVATEILTFAAVVQYCMYVCTYIHTYIHGPLQPRWKRGPDQHGRTLQGIRHKGMQVVLAPQWRTTACETLCRPVALRMPSCSDRSPFRHRPSRVVVQCRPVNFVFDRRVKVNPVRVPDAAPAGAQALSYYRDGSLVDVR
jgi:hypothetical protein